MWFNKTMSIKSDHHEFKTLDQFFKEFFPSIDFNEFISKADIKQAFDLLISTKDTLDPQIYMQLALGLAHASVLQTGGPFGTVIVNDQGSLAFGANHVTRFCDPTEHGEINAIRNAEENNVNIHGATLYTSCYPCPMCYGKAKEVGIKQIVYCNTESDAEKYGGFNDQIFWKEVNGLPSIADSGKESSKFKLCDHKITLDRNGADISTLIRDYCKQNQSFEPDQLSINIFEDEVILSLYEYTAIRWAGLQFPKETKVFLKPFQKNDLYQSEDVHSKNYGIEIFKHFQNQGNDYGQIKDYSNLKNIDG